jgi:hypothetical protein
LPMYRPIWMPINIEFFDVHHTVFIFISCILNITCCNWIYSFRRTIIKWFIIIHGRSNASFEKTSSTLTFDNISFVSIINVQFNKLLQWHSIMKEVPCSIVNTKFSKVPWWHSITKKIGTLKWRLGGTFNGAMVWC